MIINYYISMACNVALIILYIWNRRILCRSFALNDRLMRENNELFLELMKAKMAHAFDEGPLQ